MLLVRPVRLEDHEEILGLARMAGIGMTSLPPDSHVLQQKIERAVASFSGKPPYPQGEAFLFVLQDADTGRLIGTTGIVAHVGMRHPFYSYKLSTIVQASEKIGVYTHQHVLHLVNDYTGASEIGSLFVVPEYRRDGIGRFLSRCRYLMLAQFPELFSDTVISEIRGVQDEKGESPFYNHLARYFFQMDYRRVDLIYATQSSQFIGDLMPKYPIYVNLLRNEARAVIGVPFDASRPAKQMLELEGFSYGGYVDVFDGGPTLECARAHIATVQDSNDANVIAIAPLPEGTPYMVSNTRLKDFSVVRAPLAITEAGVTLTPEAAKLLNIGVGDTVRYAG